MLTTCDQSGQEEAILNYFLEKLEFNHQVQGESTLGWSVI
jgi:hypothetical protein